MYVHLNFLPSKPKIEDLLKDSKVANINLDYDYSTQSFGSKVWSSTKALLLSSALFGEGMGLRQTNQNVFDFDSYYKS
jgi:hypothetical protein